MSEIPAFSIKELTLTRHKLSLTSKSCCADGCDQYNIINATDFWNPESFYIGHSYCPKHAEMLKEEQWRYQYLE